jgi:hypothetical protein
VSGHFVALIIGLLGIIYNDFRCSLSSLAALLLLLTYLRGHFLLLANDGLVYVLLVVVCLLGLLTCLVVKVLLLLLIVLILLLLLLLMMLSKVLLSTAVTPLSGRDSVTIDTFLFVVVHALSFALSVEILGCACHLLRCSASISLSSSLNPVL